MGEVDCTCYVLIGRDVGLLNWCVSNARERAEYPHKWLVIGWDPTPEIEAWCKLSGVDFMPLPSPAIEPGDTAAFLKSLYACFNAGYELADTKWVARMGSDQFFSKGWLKDLMDAAAKHGDRGIYHCNTIESDAAKNSRHEVQAWGTTWETFEQSRFVAHCNRVRERFENRPVVTQDECGLYYRHPARGAQARPDGCTWLQTQDLWEEFGPMEDHVNAEGVTGDVAYMDRMYDAGVPGYLVRLALTYHLVRGESRGQYHAGTPRAQQGPNGGQPVTQMCRG